MITAGDIAAAKAVPMPWLVSRDIPLKKAGAVYVANCPFHADRTPSFTVYFDHAFCFGCGSAVDPIAWMRRTRHLTFEQAIRELIGASTPSKAITVRIARASRCPPETPAAVLDDLWNAANAPHLARFYLESRGIGQKSLPEALRGHPAVWCQESGRHRPSLLAAVSDGAGRITAVQRTWLVERLVYDGNTQFRKGARAADLSTGKKTLGPMGAGAVRLAAAKEITGLAESVEDALAAAKLYRLPVWSVCGAGRLGHVELPGIVRCVVIFADSDEPGRAAAAKAESAYRRRGYSAQTEYPEEGRKDFTEMLRL